MNRFSTVLLSLMLTSGVVLAKEYTVDEAISGIGSFFGKLTGSGSSTAVSNAPSGVLVKDLPDLPKLSDKPFLRGLAKLDYAELNRNNITSPQNNKLMSFAATSGHGCLRSIYDPSVKTVSAIMNFQNDAVNGKVFVRSNPISGFSNPYASDSKAFDLSSLNEATRVDAQSIYTYTLKTHFKIPDAFVKNGKFVFESQTPGVMNYSIKIQGTNMASEQMCYEMINGKILDDKKSTYTVKKGNIVDYQTTCYFGGTNNKIDQKNMIKSIDPFNEDIPSSWKVYAVPDPLAKSAGQSYTLTNRDMFLYENEVYPAK